MAAVAGCGGIEPGEDDASMRMALASASGCGYQHVHVTIASVRVHESPIAGENALGWRTLELDPPRRVDLMAMDNGVLEELGSTSLPAGRYQQLRLVLAPNTGTQPLRNSVTRQGQGEAPLSTPPAQQRGLTMRIDERVDADGRLDAVLDLDACRSVVSSAATGGYLLKPTLGILPRPTDTGLSVAGRLANLPAERATVSLQQEGRVLRTTMADDEGRFLLSPVPEGTHDLVVVAEGRASVVLARVPVTEAGRTTVVTDDRPIGLVASTMRRATGRIGLLGVGAIPEALASGLQAVGPHVIEIESRPTDAIDGSFVLRLPVQAPMLANYDPQATGYSFAPDIGHAARYTIEAAVPERPVQTLAVDIRTTDAVANFDFAP